MRNRDNKTVHWSASDSLDCGVWSEYVCAACCAGRAVRGIIYPEPSDVGNVLGVLALTYVFHMVKLWASGKRFSHLAPFVTIHLIIRQWITGSDAPDVDDSIRVFCITSSLHILGLLPSASRIGEGAMLVFAIVRAILLLASAACLQRRGFSESAYVFVVLTTPLVFKTLSL